MISLRNWFIIPLLAIGSVFAGVGCHDSSHTNGYLSKPIEMGRGIGEIQVYQSTLGQVTTILGDRFQREEREGSFGNRCVDGNCDGEFKKFSDINIDYKEFGLLFVFRKIEGEDTPDADLKLRFIRIYCVKSWSGCKFDGKTDHGIHLGSLRKDVIAAHGESNTWTGRQGTISYRKGLNFSFASVYLKIKDTDPVEGIDIFSPQDFQEFGHRSI
jgi:hypothetical protein